MSSFAHSLYARMLQARDIDRQRKLEQKRFDQEYQDRSLQRNLDEQRLQDRSKELEFQRHMKVAEAESRAASLRGRGSAPGGYFNPAVAEAARVAFESGQVERENMEYGRVAAEREQQVKLRGQDMGFRQSALGHLTGVEKSGYARQTPFARDEYVPALADPYGPLPQAQGPLTERVSEDELLRRKAAGGRSKDYDMEEALPLFANARKDLDHRKTKDSMTTIKTHPLRLAYDRLADLSRLYMEQAWYEGGNRPNPEVERRYYEQFQSLPEVKELYQILKSQQLYDAPVGKSPGSPTGSADPLDGLADSIAQEP